MTDRQEDFNLPGPIDRLRRLIDKRFPALAATSVARAWFPAR
jgi:hypothetical protein